MTSPCTVASFTFLTVALGGYAIAQSSAVIPPAMATVDGNSLDKEPFGRNDFHHLQYVDAALLTAVPPGTMLKAIAYRRDASVRQPGRMQRMILAPKFNPIWEVSLSNSTFSAMQPPGALPNRNHPAWSNVFTPKVVSFPDLLLPATGLPGFVVRFMFDVPFNYSGGTLGVRHFALNADDDCYTYFVDSVRASLLQPGTVQRISPTSVGCPAGQNRVTGSVPNPGGGTLTLNLDGAPPQAPVALLLGSSKSTWSGLSLPLSLASFGLPGCSLYTDALIVLARTTNSGGSASFGWPVPRSPRLAGATLYGQWSVANDPRVNPVLPFTMSDGVELRLGADPSAGALLMSTVTGFPFQRVGTVQAGEGLVFELSW